MRLRAAGAALLLLALAGVQDSLSHTTFISNPNEAGVVSKLPSPLINHLGIDGFGTQLAGEDNGISAMVEEIKNFGDLFLCPKEIETRGFAGLNFILLTNERLDIAMRRFGPHGCAAEPCLRQIYCDLNLRINRRGMSAIAHVNEAGIPTFIENKPPSDYGNIGARLRDANFFADIDRSVSGHGGLFGVNYGAPNKKQAKAANDDASTGGDQHPFGPLGHGFLSRKIALSALPFGIGLWLVIPSLQRAGNALEQVLNGRRRCWIDVCAWLLLAFSGTIAAAGVFVYWLSACKIC